MSTESIPLEVLAPEEKQLVAIIEQNALSADAAKSIQTSFAPLFKQAGELLTQSRAIIVTDASQVAQIKLSRAYRLELRKIRTTGENLRKSLQEDAQRRVKALNGFQHILVDLVGTEESRLEEQEKVVERAEAARKAQLKLDRETALQPYGIDTAFFNLAEMSDGAFTQLLENTQAAHVAKQEAARRAEEERIRAENERLKEEARIREENARLKKEAEEREAAAKAERERAEKEKEEAARVAKAEMDRREALAAEERRKADEANAEIRRVAAENARIAAETAKKEREAVEAKAAAERAEAKKKADAALKAQQEKAAKEQAARKKAEAELAATKAEEQLRVEKFNAELLKQEQARAAAALAPDREKLTAYVAAVRALAVPNLTTDVGKEVATDLAARLEAFAAYVERKASAL